MSGRKKGKLSTPIIVALISAGGVVLAALIALIGNFASPPSSPVVVNVNMATEVTPTLTSTPSSIFITPTVNANNQTPVLLNIETQTVQGDWGPWTERNISFYDLDGDAYVIRYTVTESSIPDIVLADSPISSNPKMQIAGTVEPLTGLVCENNWKAFFTGYSVLVSVSIVDKAGNQSNSYPLKYFCGWQ
jgi:hypothetical protein